MISVPLALGGCRLCTWLGKGNDPRYTPSTIFETFPFPAGLTPEVTAADYEGNPRAVAIAEASRRLVELRDGWLNPPEWVEWVDEPVRGYPRRPVPRHEAAAKALKKRTLTRQENIRTSARCPFEVNLVELLPLPVYRRIAFEALEMRASGVRVAEIARHFRVDHHTVDKALRWSLQP